MAEGIRVQQIWDFVVQIRHTSTDAIVGTGFVARDGIVTCAHVIRDAGVDPRAGDGREVGVYYPDREGRSSIQKRAKVAGCFHQYDDDVVLLHLVDGPSPLGPELTARFGSANGSELHEFLSFGYRHLQNYQGLPAYGKIICYGEKPKDKKFQGKPLMLSSQNVDKGMSGAPVLDLERNLIIGVIYLAWDPAGGFRDRDTGLAVDAKVLSLEPLGLAMQENDLPKSPGPSPKLDFDAREVVTIRQKAIWNNAPQSLSEWTGREQLLEDITLDWADVRVRITGLIGFGGEGKSSLARAWIDQLLADSSRPQPEGIFWWGFYEKRNVDEFFDAALNYLSGGRIDVKKIPSANMKARIIGAMLGAGRYLFVLDGLEVLQYQDGDMYGAIRSPDLKAFLEFFASPDHSSFCLVTSRAPLMDMISLATYKHRDVDRLRPEDGRDLLRNLGVQGKDKELDRVVKEWDGHALTLSLLASHLKEHHGGNVSQIENIPLPTKDEPRYDRVRRVLRRYDEHLDEASKAFLKLFSVFRKPVDRDAFELVFRAQPGQQPGLWNQLIGKRSKAINAPIAALDDYEFQAMLDKLLAYRILRYEPERGQYTAHPLIKAHYISHLNEGDRVLAGKAHQQIKDFYLAKAQNVPDSPILEDLVPFIEAVHHACSYGDYDEAVNIYWERINRRNEHYIRDKLGAYEAILEIMREFFPEGNVSKDPLVKSTPDKSWILNEMGLNLTNLGLGKLAEGFFSRAYSMALGSENWVQASDIYQNLSYLYSLSGDLTNSLQAADEALKLARQGMSIVSERDSLVYQAWTYHLQGDLEKASRIFLEAETMQKQLNSLYLFSGRGILHADHLRRRGEAEYARKVTESNLMVCEGSSWPDDISRCQRVLGDLFVDAEKIEEAKRSFSWALDNARIISNNLVLIEALLARGSLYARSMRDADAALSDLTEAFEYTRAGGYRRYEADIRIALAWAYLAAGNDNRARDEAGYALQISQDMGYHWGIVDAKEVLAKLDEK